MGRNFCRISGFGKAEFLRSIYTHSAKIRQEHGITGLDSLLLFFLETFYMFFKITK